MRDHVGLRRRRPVAYQHGADVEMGPAPLLVQEPRVDRGQAIHALLLAGSGSGARGSLSGGTALSIRGILRARAAAAPERSRPAH